MKLAALALCLAGCAAVPSPPPAGYFTCAWARVYDFQTQVAHPGMPRWAPVICGPGDVTAPAMEAASKAR